MNSDCETFIKQEFLNAEEQLINSIPGSDLNILVKNEPILDDPLSAVTIKNEPHIEATSLLETVSIKTEQHQETVSESRDSFVICELETQKTGKEISNEFSLTTSPVSISNATQATKTALQNTEASLIFNSNETNLTTKRAIDEITTKSAGPPPILLNDKLRKRNKVIITAKSTDKRKRYFIEGTSSAVTSIESSKTCRLLNPGNKKIINHFIKHKQKQPPKVLEENCDFTKSPAITRNKKSQNTAQPIEHQTTSATKTQLAALALISSTISPLSVTADIINTPKQLAESPIMPELRVKCLCSLTGNTSTDNSELKTFFEEMFMQTRTLNKIQQRKVKMTLLKAICDAEAAVEQGKCCGF